MPIKLLSIFAVLALLSGCILERPNFRLQLAANGLYSASISRSGNAAVAGSFQHGGSYWDLRANGRLYNWNHREGYLTEILYSDISDDGRYAATANYFNLVLWQTDTGEPVWFWTAPARIEAMDLSSDGRFALLGLQSNKAVLFDVQNGGVLREFDHAGPVVSVSVNVNASLALTGSQDTTATLWNLRTGDAIRSFQYRNQVSLVLLSDSGNLALMVPASETAELWSIGGRQKLAELATARYRIYSAHFIDDTRLIAGSTHRRIFEFDTATGKQTNVWQIGNETTQAFRSAIVLDVGWRANQLLAVGSNGYLYGF